MRTKLIGSIALLAILALAGCGSSGNDGTNASNQLSSLVLSDNGTLSPSFDPATTTYTATVASTVTSMTVTPTAKDTGATIKVNTVDVESSKASGSITVPGTITIIVTPKDGGATNTYTITVTHAGAGIEDIGGACQCQDDGNNLCYDPTTKNTLPAGGNITNCDIPSGITGAVKLCLRSFKSPSTLLYPSTYFPGGYCSLGATKCSLGNLCSFGDYDTMTTCPTGSIMITDSMALLSGAVPLNEIVCAKPCNDINDCRQGVSDDVWGTTNYTCSANSDANSKPCKDKDGNQNTVKFCYDARNLTNNCVVKAF